MDISSVKGKIYNYVNTTFNYTYSPCDNAVSCTLQNGSQYYVLSSQYKETNAYCTAILARNIDNVKYSFNAEKKKNGLFIMQMDNHQQEQELVKHVILQLHGYADQVKLEQ